MKDDQTTKQSDDVVGGLKDLRRKAVKDGKIVDKDAKDKYLAYLRVVVAKIDHLVNSDNMSDWEEGGTLSERCIGFLYEIAEIKTPPKERGFLSCFAMRSQRRRSRSLLISEERYEIAVDLFTLNQLYEFKKQFIRGADTTSEVFLSPLNTQPSEISKAVVKTTKFMEREISLFPSSNLRDREVKLTNRYSHWERVFRDSPAINAGIHYMKLLSQMRLHFYWAWGHIGEWRPFSRIRHFGTWILYAILWAVSGFGQRFLRFVVSAAVVVSVFAGLYSLSEDIGCRSGNIVSDLGNSFYFSIVTISTLGFGDLSPHSFSGKILVGCEVVIGYFLLAIVVTLVSERLRL